MTRDFDLLIIVKQNGTPLFDVIYEKADEELAIRECARNTGTRIRCLYNFLKEKDSAVTEHNIRGWYAPFADKYP